jgi:hypothetical protein
LVNPTANKQGIFVANTILDALESSPDVEFPQVLNLLNGILECEDELSPDILKKLQPLRDRYAKVAKDTTDSELRCSQISLIYRIDSVVNKGGVLQLDYLFDIYPTIELGLKIEFIRSINLQHFALSDKLRLFLMLFDDASKNSDELDGTWYTLACGLLDEFITQAESKDEILDIFPELLEFLAYCTSDLPYQMETLADCLMLVLECFFVFFFKIDI